MLTQVYLQEIFDYKEDGTLYWKIKRQGVQKNKPAGTKSNKYLSVMINKKHFLVHRVVFMYFHGYFPINVDHINGIKTDNRIENLRDVTNSGNQQNIRKAYLTNKSGLLGAFYSEKNKKWFSRICANNKRVWLGTFNTAEQAHKAYIEAKRNLHKTCTI